MSTNITRNCQSTMLGTILFVNDILPLSNRITKLFMTLLNTLEEEDSTCKFIIRNFIIKLRRASPSSCKKDSDDKCMAGPSTRPLKRLSSSSGNTQDNKRKKFMEEEEEDEVYDLHSVSKLWLSVS